MKIVEKKVYYCEHCNKRSLAGGHMKTHEKNCTNNPNRGCRLCNEKRDIKSIIESLKLRFEISEVIKYHDYADFGESRQDEYKEIEGKWTAEPITLSEIELLVDHCPACTLAVLRQTGLNRYYFDGMIDKFDFKVRSREYLSMKHDKPDYL